MSHWPTYTLNQFQCEYNFILYQVLTNILHQIDINWFQGASILYSFLRKINKMLKFANIKPLTDCMIVPQPIFMSDQSPNN